MYLKVEPKMNNDFTEKDIICRDFQIGKFNVKKIVPSVSMQIDVNIDNLLIKRDEINKNSKIHITLYQFLVKSIADVLINYPLLYSQFYKGKIITNRDLLVNIPVSVNNHVEYVVVRNPNEKAIEVVAEEIRKGIEDISNGLNILMQSLIEMSKMNRMQKILYKLINYKNPVNFLHKYYGYFPITNFGTFNIKNGITVLSEPIVAGIAIGKAHKNLFFVNNSIHENTNLSFTLSFDHRVMDGAYAGNFLNDLKNNIES